MLHVISLNAEKLMVLYSFRTFLEVGRCLNFRTRCPAVLHVVCPVGYKEPQYDFLGYSLNSGRDKTEFRAQAQ